jgi:hypothetical protein
MDGGGGNTQHLSFSAYCCIHFPLLLVTQSKAVVASESYCVVVTVNIHGNRMAGQSWGNQESALEGSQGRHRDIKVVDLWDFFP